MNKVVIGCFLVAMLAVPTFVKAASAAGSGTLTVTGNVSSSITLTVESAGGAFTYGGNDSTTALGTISKFGVVPTGFTRTTAATTWTLASTIGVKVEKSNSISTAYTLNAQLGAAPATGVIWTVNAVALTTGIQALTAAGVYGATPTYTWSIQIPDSLATASGIDNVVQFSAVAG